MKSRTIPKIDIIKIKENVKKYRFNLYIVLITIIPLIIYEFVYNTLFYNRSWTSDGFLYGAYTSIVNLIIFNIVKNKYENKNREILSELNRQIDILKYTKEGLRISEKKLRQIMENNLDLIVTMNGDNNVVSVNGIGFNALGYSQDEVIGKNALNLIHEEDLKRIKKDINKLKMEKEVNAIEIEFRYKCKDGNYIWLQSRGNLIEDETDNLKMIFSTRDITARKKVEQALIESENKFRELFNKANDSIIVHEVSNYSIEEFSYNKVIEINEAACKRLGYTRDEILNKTIVDFFCSIEGYDSREFVRQLMKNGEVTFIAYLIAKNGEKVLVESSSSICEINGEKVVMAISRDLTERIKTDAEIKSLNDQVQYEKLKTEFFANISHELKTPINVILAAEQLMWSMLKNGYSEGSCVKLFQYMKMIKQNSLRLIRLVNNLIDITKIDSGYLKPNFKNCNIVSVVEDISLSVAAYIENKNINLIFDTDVEEKIIACDEEKIERIILNLLSNSVKFTDSEGSIFVTVKDKGASVIISVRDTGIGIPEDKREEIFNRFVQVDKTFSRNKEGSGIGLSLVKALVEMHNGTISLESELNNGSEFIIELPALIDSKAEESNGIIRDKHDKIERINIEFSDIYEAI